MLQWGPQNNIEIRGESYPVRAYQPLYEYDVHRILDVIFAKGNGKLRAGTYVLQQLIVTGGKLYIVPVKGDPLDPVAIANAPTPNNARRSMRRQYANGQCGALVSAANRKEDTLEYEPSRFRGLDSQMALRPGSGPRNARVAPAWVPTHWNSRLRPLDPGNRFLHPDDVLLHELVHEMRIFKGLACARPFGEGYDNVEELFAITVANVYRSERGRNDGLRADHASTFNVSTQTDEEFFSGERSTAFEAICDEPDMRDFAEDMATIECQYNPFRVWKFHKRLREAMGSGGVLSDLPPLSDKTNQTPGKGIHMKKKLQEGALDEHFQ